MAYFPPSSPGALMARHKRRLKTPAKKTAAMTSFWVRRALHAREERRTKYAREPLNIDHYEWGGSRGNEEPSEKGLRECRGGPGISGPGRSWDESTEGCGMREEDVPVSSRTGALIVKDTGTS